MVLMFNNIRLEMPYLSVHVFASPQFSIWNLFTSLNGKLTILIVYLIGIFEWHNPQRPWIVNLTEVIITVNAHAVTKAEDRYRDFADEESVLRSPGR